MRQGRERGRKRGGMGGGGGGKEGGVHRVLDHTYPELSVARATLVFIGIKFILMNLNVLFSNWSQNSLIGTNKNILRYTD